MTHEVVPPLMITESYYKSYAIDVEKEEEEEVNILYIYIAKMAFSRDGAHVPTKHCYCLLANTTFLYICNIITLSSFENINSIEKSWKT